MPKPARPDVSELEQKILAAAGKARPESIRCATVLGDGNGAWCMVVLECLADGRWRELRRSEPTGKFWAEQQLADEIHRQNLARGAG